MDAKSPRLHDIGHPTLRDVHDSSPVLVDVFVATTHGSFLKNDETAAPSPNPKAEVMAETFLLALQHLLGTGAVSPLSASVFTPASPAGHVLLLGLSVRDTGPHLAEEVSLGCIQVSPHAHVELLPKLARNFATMCA